MRKIFLIIITISFVLYLYAQKKPGQDDDVNASKTRGKAVYKQVCLTCHQADGGGVPNLNPPLINTSYVLGDKTKLIVIVLTGMSDRIPIEDEYYSNNMASHADLSDKQIADVLTYIRNEWDNKASEVTPAEVKAVRKQTKK
jgi:mono/diheme cytochrome c family protein